MTADMATGQRASKRVVKALLVTGLIVGAIAFNFPTLRRALPVVDHWAQDLFGTGQDSPAGGAPALIAEAPSSADSLLADGQDPGAAPAAESVLWRRPVALGERIPDPFVRRVRRPETLPAPGPGPEDAISQLGELPEVSLVLVGEASLRAVVGGNIVTVGDRIKIGKVVAIESDGVRVHLDRGSETKLPLRSREASSAGLPAQTAAVPTGQEAPRGPSPSVEKGIQRGKR